MTTQPPYAGLQVTPAGRDEPVPLLGIGNLESGGETGKTGKPLGADLVDV